MSEAVCPFCGAQFADAFRASPQPQAPGARLTRAAFFAFGTGTLALAPACTSSSEPLYGSPPVVVPVYGAPAMMDSGDTGDGGGTVPEASIEAGPGAPDGAPGQPGEPMDASAPIKDASEDHTNVMALYGAVPH